MIHHKACPRQCLRSGHGTHGLLRHDGDPRQSQPTVCRFGTGVWDRAEFWDIAGGVLGGGIFFKLIGQVDVSPKQL